MSPTLYSVSAALSLLSRSGRMNQFCVTFVTGFCGFCKNIGTHLPFPGFKRIYYSRHKRRHAKCHSLDCNIPSLAALYEQLNFALMFISVIPNGLFSFTTTLVLFPRSSYIQFCHPARINRPTGSPILTTHIFNFLET
jgi:hypothetical protein